MQPSLIFHHIGYAVHDWKKELVHLAALGYAAEGDPFQDPHLGVEGIFAVIPSIGGGRLELLQNLPGSTMLDPFLQAGIKCYHLAYEVDELEKAIAHFQAQRAVLTVAPTPAVAFAGRRVAFVMLRNMQLVELIEH